MGAHSPECADAEPGSLCDCDCAGAQHATKRAGRPAAGSVSPRARRAAAREGRPVVLGKGTAEGAKVTASSKTAALPPPTVAWAKKVRDSMPKTRDAWNDLIGREQTAEEYARAKVADERQRQAVWVKRRDDFLAMVTKSMVEQGMTKRQIAAEIKKTNWIDLQRADEAIAAAEEYIRKAEAQLATLLAVGLSPKGKMRYPRDTAGTTLMPGDEINKQLDRVMDVGKQVLAAAQEQFDRHPEIGALTKRLAVRADLARRKRATWEDKTIRGSVKLERLKEIHDAEPPGSAAEDHRELARLQHEILRQLLASARPFGGVSHGATAASPATVTTLRARSGDTWTDVRAAPADHHAQMVEGEGYYPTGWLKLSAAEPLQLVATHRQFYSSHDNILALGRLPSSRDYDGGFSSYDAEVVVHELGHRMEQMVPGLTHLEFAMVRRRSTDAKGTVEDPQKLDKILPLHGYRSNETAFLDKWNNPYAGKTYENSRTPDGPANEPWELFQVGTQDLYGRSTTRFDASDELQQFTIGALLTLGS